MKIYQSMHWNAEKKEYSIPGYCGSLENVINFLKQHGYTNEAIIVKINK